MVVFFEAVTKRWDSTLPVTHVPLTSLEHTRARTGGNEGHEARPTPGFRREEQAASPRSPYGQLLKSDQNEAATEERGIRGNQRRKKGRIRRGSYFGRSRKRDRYQMEKRVGSSGFWEKWEFRLGPGQTEQC